MAQPTGASIAAKTLAVVSMSMELRKAKAVHASTDPIITKRQIIIGPYRSYLRQTPQDMGWSLRRTTGSLAANERGRNVLCHDPVTEEQRDRRGDRLWINGVGAGVERLRRNMSHTRHNFHDG